MRSALGLLSAILAASIGCLQIGTGVGSDGGAGSALNDGSPPSARADAADGPVGLNCFEDPITLTVLCGQVGPCPTVVVDPATFPDCGFRLHAGGALDLECLCGTALCPIGVPKTCEQAKQLLDVQNALGVCTQRAEGRCVEVVTADAGAPGTCDRSCADSCGGSPSCIQFCGC